VLASLRFAELESQLIQVLELFLNFYFYFKLIFFYMFLNHFDVLISKLIFLKKYYFNVFWNEKHFEKQPILHFKIHYIRVSLIKFDKKISEDGDPWFFLNFFFIKSFHWIAVELQVSFLFFSFLFFFSKVWIYNSADQIFKILYSSTLTCLE